MKNESFDFEASRGAQRSAQSNLIGVYTMVRILDKMSRELGLEAMLEYMRHYQAVIEKDNARFHEAVSTAFDKISVDRIYQEMTQRAT